MNEKKIDREKRIKMIVEGINNLATVPLPKITEDEQNGWVKWGRDNLFPAVLIDGLNSSPTHNSIILTKKNITAGKRIVIAPQRRGLFGRLFGGGTDQRTQQFIDLANDTGESLHDVIKKIAYDIWVYQQAYYQPVYKKDGRLQIYHIPAENVRSGIATNGVVTDYYYSENWKSYRREKYKPVRMKLFDYNDKRSVSIVPILDYRPGNQYYPLPEYYPAMNYIELDGHISKFHLSNIQNGLFPSLMLQFNNGIPPEEQRMEMKKKIDDTLSGSYNAGKFLLLFNETKENEASIKMIETNDIDKLYILLNDMVLQNILTASRLTSPLLIGIKTSGQLGIVDEFKSAYALFYNQVILPVQNRIMNSVNKVAEFSGLQPMAIETPSPMQFVFSESIIGKILTINELREEIGYQAREDGDILVEYEKYTENLPDLQQNNNDNNA